MKMLLKGDLPSGEEAQRVAEQMEGQAMAASKWPSLAANEKVVYPRRLSREQSSSEAAAREKAQKIGAGATVADLTGGMGVDSLMFARRASHVDYVEQDECLCDVMEHNARVLGLDNVTCHRGDSVAWLAATHNHFDWIYIDPARRGQQGQKLVRLADCQPNVLEMLPLLRSKGTSVMIKTSPMIDLHESLRQLGEVAEVDIVAVGHECKEVLFIADGGGQSAAGGPKVCCVDIWNGGEWRNEFVMGEERPVRYADEVKRYVYEPNAALMKGGPWGEIGEWYGVEKLDRNTHLYTSERLVERFAGRVFEVEGELKLNKKAAKAAVERANVLTRNYPVDAATLRRQLAIGDGGDQFIIATTVKGEKKGLLCHRV